MDDFKQANDTLGHAFGDDILCCMAKRILGVFRQTDIAARYGGDEFVVFVPSVGREILELSLIHIFLFISRDRHLNECDLHDNPSFCCLLYHGGTGGTRETMVGQGIAS